MKPTHPADPIASLMAREETRRQLFARGAQGIGALALASLLGQNATAAPEGKVVGGIPGLPHFAPKAKRCIYLHMVGAPPHSAMILFGMMGASAL